MKLRVLVVESDPSDAIFLLDVLAEAEESNLCPNWSPIEKLHCSVWDDAAAILESEPIDALFLSLDFPKQPEPQPELQGREAGLNEYLRIVRDALTLAPAAAILLLSDGQTNPRTHLDIFARLLREGVQDVIDKRHVDFRSLAFALWNAVERQRLLICLRSSSVVDPLTGLLTRTAFLNAADRDWTLAVSLARKFILCVVELSFVEPEATQDGTRQLRMQGFTAQRLQGFAQGSHPLDLQARDLLLLKAVDVIRETARATDLIGRTDERQFALTLIDTAAEPIDTALQRIHAVARDISVSTALPVRVGYAIFDPANPSNPQHLLEDLLDEAIANLAIPPPRTAAVMRP